MNIHEYQAKALLREFGAPLSKGVPAFTPDEGAQIVADAEPKIGAPALGHITSSYMSATLGRSFCLALVADGRARLGQTLYATGMEAARPVTV